jgi:hypothetical protein
LPTILTRISPDDSTHTTVSAFSLSLTIVYTLSASGTATAARSEESDNPFICSSSTGISNCETAFNTSNLVGVGVHDIRVGDM